jgi:uncharacterized membrane protein YdjX (TVP38/TMEM64 family)
LLRLSPVLPYNILNYALAITPVSFWVFTIASAVATVPWTALYVYLGTFSNNLMELAQVMSAGTGAGKDAGSRVGMLILPLTSPASVLYN